MTFPILNKLKRIDINTELTNVLRTLEKQILDLNTDDQLFEKGITITGVKIIPPYADSTVRTKRRKGQPTNRVTTRDQGGYHKSFKVQFGRDEFEIIVFFETQRGFNLAEHLEKTYGELTGLTNESIDKLTGMILQPLINSIALKL